MTSTAEVAAPTTEAKTAAANSIRTAISNRGNRIRVPGIPTTFWNDLNSAHQNFVAIAQDTASNKEKRSSNRNRCAKAINDLRVELDKSRTALRDMVLEFEPPTAEFLCIEFDAIHREFGNLKIAPNAKKLVARTQPIFFEVGSRKIELGCFDLAMSWNEANGVFEISPIAVTPNPADGSEGRVTHPHVKENKLCPGEGATATQAAFNEGRFSDAFMIVRSTLETYYPESAFMKLDRWTVARICRICSDTPVAGIAFATCRQCGGDRRCPNCMLECGREGCTLKVCASCIFTCPVCRTQTCGSCTKRCAHCNISLCKGCFETRQCTNTRNTEGRHVVA